MKIKIYKALENPTIEDVERVIKEKIGDKYTYKSTRKADSVAGKILNGNAQNTIIVIKNAYHRIVVAVETVKDPTDDNGQYTTLRFSTAELAGWLRFLHREGGLLGSFIIRLIYGSNDPIYDEVRNIVKDNFKIEEQTLDVGIGTLFNRT
ncbi:hypothetical protein [Aquimarina brevivitae]|uniref:Uncharacterized protein n=1 Tax=Aquimarina brevivitae TaxID=323412 RepID=A0A4Q7PJ20_9FLAO|nr:hypothetical protein [Aquimarina brevivitae]RZS99830.1 hypothetical protein EV197_1058 [Aquimarina brevivitae]